MNELKSTIIILAALVVFLTSCEKDIDFNSQYESGIAIYSLVMPGEPFTLRVSRSFSVNDNPVVIYSHYSEYYSEIDSLYRSEIVIKDATAEVIVNGADKYSLHYDETKPYVYVCDYIPKEGDNIAITVNAAGYKAISATAKVEKAQKVEIVKTEVVYKENGYDGSTIMVNPLFKYGVDSVMLITMRLNDPVGEHNFYRLKVRGVAEGEEVIVGSITRRFYSLCDVFDSDDIIFADNQLTKPFGDWKAGFSNVFDDHLFNGQSYTFTVETRKRYCDNPRVIVELETISQDLYYFLKSYQVFRISTDDVYMTPIGLYSNIKDGWGILGSLSYDRHIIYY